MQPVVSGRDVQVKSQVGLTCDFVEPSMDTYGMSVPVADKGVYQSVKNGTCEVSSVFLPRVSQSMSSCEQEFPVTHSVSSTSDRPGAEAFDAINRANRLSLPSS